MKQSLRLGRIAGIPVGVNWSVIIIAALIGWTLAASVLPEMAPGSSTVAYWAVGAAAALLFFASLLTHELAHALVGRRKGVPVVSITLWLLGGVSQFQSEPASSDAELRIALAGPLTSLGLALGFGALSAVGSALHLPELISGALFWLCAINLMLGLFNLVPAYPLDGGRVLRAAVWTHDGDRLAATRTAARVGHVLAWALIALGLLLALVNLVSGLWLVLIGWFLDNAGRAEATAVAEQSTLGSLPVARLMSPAPVTVARDITVDDLVHGYVLGRHHSAFPVVGEAGHPVGLVSLDQVRQVPPERRSSLTVGEIAEPLPRVPVVGPGDTGADVLDRMRSAGASRALVIDDQGRLVGIVSHSDLVRALQVTVPPPPLPPSSRDR
ncbi:MAG: site-2 protease family protein [Acidimicrobiales bacterium]